MSDESESEEEYEQIEEAPADDNNEEPEYIGNSISFGAQKKKKTVKKVKKPKKVAEPLKIIENKENKESLKKPAPKKQQ